MACIHILFITENILKIAESSSDRRTEAGQTERLFHRFFAACRHHRRPCLLARPEFGSSLSADRVPDGQEFKHDILQNHSAGTGSAEGTWLFAAAMPRRELRDVILPNARLAA